MMVNKQKPNGGIEWTHVFGPGSGHTWNPVAGCKHACQWQMPDGSVAQCYARSIAEGLARTHYPNGFAHHYFHPDRLDEPLKRHVPAGIFLDSVSDVMGHWVPGDQVRAVLDVCRQTPQHVYFLLTKNAPRLSTFAEAFPPNVWIGVSMPPTWMWGKRLSPDVQVRLFTRALNILRDLRSAGLPNVLWVSLEPLSFDVAPLLHDTYGLLDWIVIGAATNGRQTFQPDPNHVQDVLDFADWWDIPVFFKGNLEWVPWFASFPTVDMEIHTTPTQQSLFGMGGPWSDANGWG
jgi:protein gp37